MFIAQPWFNLIDDEEFIIWYHLNSSKTQISSIGNMIILI